MCEATGPCCKCGRNTRHSYSYYTVEGRVSKKALPAGLAEEHRAFLCTMCASAGAMVCASLAIAGHAAVGIPALLLGFDATVPLGVAGILFVLFVPYTVYAAWQDRALPFYISSTLAEQHLIKHLQKQNPGEDKTYFRYSDFN